MRVQISSKRILSLVIIAAGTMASYYVNVLWLNIITLAAIAVLAVVLNFEFLSSTYNAAIGKVFGKR